ncbi:hypothetical protein WQ54_14215 [Bacillus sp. SA1-12]|uniref:TetR/AcrR family transcriptional regulator n=1 Tax=Bacillus sp. SA1-12 TaxID=1455638 RepID=UPI0006266FFD|nr:TetR/AcrR family transcriptional regulator [Bacillus sp. SA1-12]KKI91544.1 hypothetical protein WQ54_14215 [Bacillus sp. SA1-12]
MSKEKGLKGKESKARIKAAAAYEFAKHGFHQTKISNIVKRASLTQPAFYLYFSSKDAIFNELVNEFRTKLCQLIEAQRLSPLMEKDELIKQMTASIEKLFEFFAEDPNLTRIGLVLAPDSEIFKEKLIKLVADNLRFEQRSGTFRSELSMEIAAVCILGMIEQLIFQCLLKNKSNPIKLAEEVVKLVMSGMMESGSV